ncbi:MAG: Pyridine nucleotide-disulfide oxidoreductase, FAD/NAD(P)-binding domain protein [Gemmatimonadetes bacterium]|jgi:thioredoxin reductase|nr:Pyridine nucleotide-disulfide oxidoreductase, FAD/NAD(P)-binding domain protein [Gemmatimonadota bacterium]
MKTVKTVKPYDVAIVGGGPAGLSASIWLARYLHEVVLIDSGDPRNWETRGINGFLGHPGIRPAELRGMGRDEARSRGVTLVDAHVETVKAARDDEFALELADGTPYRARRILLAIGLRDVWPRIPGLREVYGANAHVCPDCDGHECVDKKVVVIGKGRKAVGMALNLTTWTRDIIICTNGEPAGLDLGEYCEKLDALNIPVLESRITSIDARDARVHALELQNGMSLDADKVFFAIGQYPHDDLGAQLGCDRDAGGHIIVDDAYHTSVMNCFAAGDIVPGPQLAIAAAGDGAIAALAIHKSLVPEERKLQKLDVDD